VPQKPNAMQSIKENNCVIDTDAEPHIPKGFKIHSHKKIGKISFDPSRVNFHVSEKQKKGDSIEGYELYEELKNRPTINACVLDFLLKNQDMIPEKWKERDENGCIEFILFLGTVYSGRGNLCVRYLSWNEVKNSWDTGICWLIIDYPIGFPVAIFAN
jgi:hypothetical protein